MKAGTASFDTNNPLMTPIAIPASRPAAMLAGRPTFASMSRPLIIGQIASRPARDRSIPLMTMTNVIPTAHMPMIEDCLTTLSRFARSKKCGTWEPTATKPAAKIRRTNPCRATGGMPVINSKRPFASFRQVGLVVNHCARVDHLGESIGRLLAVEHLEEILHRDGAHFDRELSHRADDGALFHQVHRFLGAVYRQDLYAAA